MLSEIGHRLASTMNRRLGEARLAVDGLARGIPEPMRLIQEKSQSLDGWLERWANARLPYFRRRADRDDVLANVPIIAAIHMAQPLSIAGQFELRVPKMQPRNPAHTPTAVEESVIRQFQNGDDPEITLVEADKIRYFRPIKLTEECLVCHGSPAGATRSEA